jgi:hypothetical protein
MKRFSLAASAALALSLVATSAWAQPANLQPSEQKTGKPSGQQSERPADKPADKPSDMAGDEPGGKPGGKPADKLTTPKDEHPPQFGVVTQIVGYVRVYRWPYGYVYAPVTRTYYIVVVWNPKCSCYGVYDPGGVFYPYYGPLLGDAPQPKPSDKKSGAGKPAGK